MSEKKAQQRRDLAGQLWLSYYNRVLYEKGLITEHERNKMTLKISGWKAPALWPSRGL